MKKYILILVIFILFFSGFYFFQTNKDSALIQTSLTSTSVIKEKPIENHIIFALAQKNNWSASNVEVKVTSIEGDYAKGDVKFKDEMSGGLWFATRVNGTWEIVYDGNGIILCRDLIQYPDFPSSLIPQCFDNIKDMLINR